MTGRRGYTARVNRLEIYEPDFVVDEKTGAFACLLCMPVRPL